MDLFTMLIYRRQLPKMEWDMGEILTEENRCCLERQSYKGGLQTREPKRTLGARGEVVALVLKAKMVVSQILTSDFCLRQHC